ncbi:hypothetical protein NKH95_01750 [Mesorhizobium sp. M0848]|uniref:hypothetical protein n=1 Tax=Mesorhizobium sp. M0848 TaxID=2957012 RepID=UPI00333BC883
MTAVWTWVTGNADWLSALCGLLSAFVLAWPLVGELPKRRRHDVVLKITRKPKSAPRAGFEDDSGDVDTLEGEMISDRMGGYAAAAGTVIAGLALLALSFGLALIYAINKP